MEADRILTNQKHIREYLFFYGAFAALVFMVPAWYFLHSADYNNSWVVYMGSILFMFVIMFYCYQLSRRQPEYKITMMMMAAAHIAIAVGVVLSVLTSLVLRFMYIPGFMTGKRLDSYLADATSFTNRNNLARCSRFFFLLPW